MKTKSWWLKQVMLRLNLIPVLTFHPNFSRLFLIAIDSYNRMARTGSKSRTVHKGRGTRSKVVVSVSKQKKNAWTRQVSYTVASRAFHGRIFSLSNFVTLAISTGRSASSRSHQRLRYRHQDAMGSHCQEMPRSFQQAVSRAMDESFTSRCQEGKLDGSRR